MCVFYAFFPMNWNGQTYISYEQKRKKTSAGNTHERWNVQWFDKLAIRLRIYE